MKKLLLILALFSFSTIYAGEWDLFPLKQKSYFYSTSIWYGPFVDLYLMDSVSTSGQESFLRFRKNLKLDGAGTCYQDTFQSILPGNFYFGSSNPYYLDSLVTRNDTVFHFSDQSTLPFYFLPNAIVGQSWTITSTNGNNNYNQITITCAGIQLETFWGITDSVKTFTMQPNGTSSNQIPVDNFVIRLSKNYGLIEFVPFELFLYHPNNMDFTSLKLIGIDSSGITYGYKQPKFEDYFHLSVGDILLWKRFNDPDWIMLPNWTEYYRDSIIQTLITPDSVIYTFNRQIKNDSNVITQQNNLTIKFIKSGFQNIIETPTNWIGFGNNQFGIYHSTNNVTYWTSSFLYLDIDSIVADSITSFSFFGDGSSIDTTNCIITQTLDVGYNLTVNTHAGVEKYCYNNHGTDCITLIGSKINGNQTGSIDLSVDEKEFSALTLKIYPNPASTILNIESETYNSLNYFLYTVNGEIVFNGHSDRNTETIKLNITTLTPGIYFLKVHDDKNIACRKIVVSP